MKKIFALASGISFASISVLQAVPRPGGTGEPNIVPVEDVAPQREIAPAANADVAFLGISGTPLSQLLADHLQLTGGLVVGLVAKGSPAEAAGLLENDIVLKVGNESVASQDQLSDVMQGLKPGDSQRITLIRKGKETTLDVVLGARPAQLIPQHRQRGGGGGRNQRMDDLLRKALGGLPHGGGGGNAADIMQQLHERMGQMGHGFDDLDQFFGGGLNGGKLDNHIDRMRQMMGQLDGQFGFQADASSSFSFADESGKITIREKDGQRELTAYDQNGKIIFDGPFTTELDKSAVPAEVLERLKGVKIQGLDLGQ